MPSAPPSGTVDVRRDGVGAVEDKRGIALRQAGHGPGVHELGAAGGDVRTRGHDARGHGGVHREDLIFLPFRDEHLLQLLHFVRILVGDVPGLAEVLVQVVEFEDLVVERVGIGGAEGLPRRAVHLGAQQPAFVIQGPLAHHLEILGLVPGRFPGVLLVKRVGEARAFDGFLLDAVHGFGCGDAADLKEGGHHVDDVHELLAEGARILDMAGPGYRHALPDTAELRCVLLEPGEGRIKGPGPAGRHVVVGLLGAPDIVPLHLDIDGHGDAVEERDFVGCSERAALGAGAVVAVDVDDKRVVKLAHVFDGLDDPADFVIVVSLKGGEDLDLLDEEFFLLGRAIVPVLEHLRRPGLQLGVRRNHPKALLVLENPLPQLVPAVVKKMHVVDLVHPFLGRVMRRVRGAGNVITEERLARIDLVQAVHPVNRIVGHGGNEIPARLALEGIDLRGVAEQVRLPLIGVTADEPVEILKAHADRPLVERSDRAGLEGRRVVVLAKPRCGETVVQQDAADGGLVLGDDAVVARKARGLFRDDAKTRRVMVAPGNQRGARRRTERGGVNVIVAQPGLCDAIHGRCRDDAAEGARHAEARVVGHDEQDVGGLLGRHHARRPPCFGLKGVVLDHAAEFRIGCRKLLSAEGRCGGGRTRHRRWFALALSRKSRSL